MIYNIAGTIGTFFQLSGVRSRIDVPNFATMAAPKPTMFVSCQQDRNFPIEAQIETENQILSGFTWEGCPRNFRSYRPDKAHCYKDKTQAEAINFLVHHFKS